MLLNGDLPELLRFRPICGAVYKMLITHFTCLKSVQINLARLFSKTVTGAVIQKRIDKNNNVNISIEMPIIHPLMKL